MVLGQNRRAVGVFSDRNEAELALRELRDSNFPMDRVSVITRDAARNEDIAGADVSKDVREHSSNKADEGATAGALAGGTLGGLTGLLVGLGTLAIPGVGPILLAGATATTIATTLAGGAIGAVAGSLIGSLVGLGIPEERARVYNERVSRGGYLVIVEGTDEEIRHAEAILSDRGIEEWGVYDQPDATLPRTGYNRRAVGVFSHSNDADAALAELRDAGFNMSQVSLVAREYDHQRGIAGLDVRDRFDNARFGFPDERARFFNDRVDRGDYVVMVNGTDDEIRRAETVLNRHGIREWGLFDAPDFERRTDYTSTDQTDYDRATTPRSALVHNRRAIGVFNHRRDAEAALSDLRDAGFPMSQLSLVGKDTQGESPSGSDVTNRTRTDEGAKAGAATGGILGGLGGLLVGLGALAIPGIGPVLAGGALATALATSAAGGAIGAAAGGITGALVGLGIPDERARFYNDRVSRGDYLVMVDGTEDEIRRAEGTLSRRGIQDWGIFAASDVTPGRTSDLTGDRDLGRDREVLNPGTTPGVNTTQSGYTTGDR